MTLRQTLHAFIDRLAAAGSLLCAVHCAALPLVLVIAPALAAGVLWSESLERLTVLCVALMGLSSLGWGWWKHRSIGPVLLLLPGLALMVSAIVVPAVHQSVPAHATAMAAGGVLVALAHLFNLRLVRGRVHGTSCVCAPGSC